MYFWDTDYLKNYSCIWNLNYIWSLGQALHKRQEQAMPGMKADSKAEL